MKILFCVLISSIATSLSAQNAEKSTAIVNEYQGLYIFVESKPVSKFEKIGYIKFDKFWATDNSFTNMRDRFTQKCKEKYPNADGIILYLTDEKNYAADVIKFN